MNIVESFINRIEDNLNDFAVASKIIEHIAATNCDEIVLLKDMPANALLYSKREFLFGIKYDSLGVCQQALFDHVCKSLNGSVRVVNVGGAFHNWELIFFENKTIWSMLPQVPFSTTALNLSELQVKLVKKTWINGMWHSFGFY